MDYYHQRGGRHHLRGREIPAEGRLPGGLPDQAPGGLLLAISPATQAPGKPAAACMPQSDRRSVIKVWGPAESFAAVSMVTSYKSDESFLSCHSFMLVTLRIFDFVSCLAKIRYFCHPLYRLVDDVCVCSTSHQRGVSGWKQGTLEQGEKFTGMFVGIVADPTGRRMFSRAAHCWERSTITP